jgi:hypothetical protein
MTPTQGKPVVWLDATVSRTVSPRAAPTPKANPQNAIVMRRILLIGGTVPRTA